jgi:hypothetical protein
MAEKPPSTDNSIHSRSLLRLKQETARPTQFPQDDPSFARGMLYGSEGVAAVQRIR